MFYDVVHGLMNTSIRAAFRTRLMKYYDVTEVASFYYEQSPKEVWNAHDDFGPVLMPGDENWFEYVLPEKLNIDGDLHANPAAGCRVGIYVGEGPADLSILDLTEKTVKAITYNYFQSQITTLGGIAGHILLGERTPDTLWEELDNDSREFMWKMSKAAVDDHRAQGYQRSAQSAVWVQPNPLMEVQMAYRMAWQVDKEGRIPWISRGEHGTFMVEVRDMRNGGGHVTTTTGIASALTFLHPVFMTTTWLHSGIGELTSLHGSDHRFRVVRG